MTVQVNEAEPEFAGRALSVAVTVTAKVPDAVGLPEMVPFDRAMESPAGRPVADQVMTGAGEVWESVADGVTGVMVAPSRLFWAGMGATVTVLVTIQVKWTEPLNPALSVAVTLTVFVLPADGVPLTVPLAGSMARPAGSPVAE